MFLYLLNLFDLAFTIHAVSRGVMELNPLMRNIPFMVAWKVLGIGFFCWVLEKLAKNFRVSRWGIRICTVAFAAVDLWHIVNL
jgi:hypothetical protein